LDSQKSVGYNIQELYARSSILQKKIFETLSKVRVIAKANEEIGVYIGKLVSKLNTWQLDHDQDIKMGNFVYFSEVTTIIHEDKCNKVTTKMKRLYML